MQVHIHGQWMLPSLMHSFVGQSSIRELCPPALVLERERTEGRKREKFYIYLDVTHTHRYLVDTLITPQTIPTRNGSYKASGWHWALLTCQAYPSCATSARCTRCGRCHGAQLKVGESWEITIRQLGNSYYSK